MYEGNSFIAIIPARSGSKGIKDKNIKSLNGKPMIAYTIEAALKSNIFDDVVVSTDSEKYASIAEEHGARVPFLRPKELASDTSTTIDVIEYTLIEMEKMGYTYDYFMLLQPTSPLRNVNDIQNAVKILFELKANSIVSVCEAEHSPLLMNTLDETLSMDNFIHLTNHRRRQDLTPYYRLNGAIYLSKVKLFLQKKTFYGIQSFAYIMDKNKSIDVDSEIDFELVKILLNNNDL
ncbi:cytidylyltransferase domain-containing protein [Ornithinibacillus salinisoli]|uniref:Cytidylyltransferase domain-containing protein n=1 Tax=Ornithinibacillus salinisoli TaxID=1848459 RepID=A0ABW4W0F6_9BACI